AAFHYGQVNGEGLTPGFWKTNADNNAAVAWPRNAAGQLIYATTATLESVFDVPDNLGRDNTTLVQALALGASGTDGLLRAAAAGLLSATHPRVAYPLTARQVIDQTNAALASGNSTQINTLRTTLDGYNNLGSDLDQNGNTNGPQFAAELP